MIFAHPYMDIFCQSPHQLYLFSTKIESLLDQNHNQSIVTFSLIWLRNNWIRLIFCHVQTSICNHIGPVYISELIFPAKRVNYYLVFPSLNVHKKRDFN